MGLKFLILEDSEFDAELIAREIQKSIEGAECNWSQSMYEFIQKFETWEPDFILSDYNLLGLTGGEVLKYVRERAPELPFIAISGSITPEMEVVLLQNKANDVLTKNNLSRLPYAINRILREEKQRKELIKKNEQLQWLVKEKETLIQEVHHRVKNNLALVSSFLSLERYKPNIHPEVLDLITTNLLRIKSIALVHEFIYKTRDFSLIDIGEIVKNLASNISLSETKAIPSIKVTLEEEHLYLNVNRAIPFALLFVEIFDKLINSGVFVQEINMASPIEIRIYKKDPFIRLEIIQKSIFNLFKRFEKVSDFNEITNALCTQLDAEMTTVNELKALRIEFQQILDIKGAAGNLTV